MHLGLSNAITSRNNLLGLPSVLPLTIISDFEDANVQNNFAGNILQGTGAAITRVDDGTGNFVAQFTAGPESGGTVGKGLLFYRPDFIDPLTEITVEFDLYLGSGSTADWDGQKFFDLENNLIANSPGIRMTMYVNGGDVGLYYERSKIGAGAMNPLFLDQPLALDTWHRIRTTVKLGDATTGRARIWIDETLVLDEIGLTYMDQATWDTNGGTGAITPGANSFQFGSTANNDSTGASIVAMDDIGFSLDTSGILLPTNIVNFADFKAFSDNASANPGTAYDLQAATDRAALKASVGRDSTNALKVLGVDALDPGMSYDPVTQIVTIGAGTTGIIQDWHFLNVRVDIVAPIPGLYQCLFEDTLKQDEGGFDGGANTVIYLYSGGECLFIDNVTYQRTWGMLDGRGSFIQNRTPGEVPMRDCRIDGIQGDFARPDWGIQIERCWIECRALDDTPEYIPTNTYDTGDYTVNASGHLFVALADGLTGNGNAPPTSKVSTAQWQNIDRHVDGFQAQKAEYAGLDPSQQFVRNSWIEFTDAGNGPFVHHYWLQLTTALPDDPYFTVLFENVVFARPDGSPHEAIRIQGTDRSIADHIFKGCWVTPANNGNYADITDAHALWLNNRNLETGMVTALPVNTSDDTTMNITASSDGTTLVVDFGRTPIPQAGGAVTIRQGGAVVETISITAGTLSGESSLEFTPLAALTGDYSLHISDAAVQDVNAYFSPAILDDTTLTFSVVSGYHAAVISQSEGVVGYLDNGSFSTGNNIYPAVATGADMEIMIPAAANDGETTHGIHAITQAAADARTISPGAVAIANLWHIGSGGAALRLSGVSVSGTSMNAMMDDDITTRVFADEKTMVDDAITAWGPVSRVTYNWYVSESAASDDLWNERAAHFFGINPDGSDYDFVTGDLEHCLIDTTGRGFGMFADNVVVDMMYPGNAIGADSQTTIDPRYKNYRREDDGITQTLARTIQNGAPAFEQRRQFLTNAPAPNTGIATVSPALAVMGDYTGGVQNAGQAQVFTHPALQTKYGQILYSQDIAFSLLCSYGFATPTRLNRTEVASDGAYVDFIFDLPAGANLTTHRIEDGLIVTSPRPHQQEVMGFVIWRDGDTINTGQPLFRTDNTDAVLYPTAYRGTALIHASGTDVTGGREGIVRITPDEAFENGDVVTFGDDGGYGAFIIHGHPDYDAQLALDGLRAHEARLDDATTYAYPGGPVVNQESVTISGVTVVTPPTSLIDFDAIAASAMYRNFRAVNSDTPNKHTITLSAGTAASSYEMLGLTSGTSYTATVFVSATVAQTLDLRVSNLDTLSNASWGEVKNVAIGTDAANPTEVSVTFTAGTTNHIGFRGTAVAGDMRYHALDWTVVAA